MSHIVVAQALIESVDGRFSWLDDVSFLWPCIILGKIQIERRVFWLVV